MPYLTSTAVPKPQRRELPEERPVVRERKPQKAIRTKPQIHPISSGFTVVGLLTAAFLIMLVISGYVQLYEATSEVADLNDELETVQQEQATLQSQYESKIDLDYLDLCEPDHAEIVKAEQTERSANIFSALRDGVTGMIGYFREYFS